MTKIGWVFILLVSFLSCNETGDRGIRLDIDTLMNKTDKPDSIPQKITIREDSLAGRPITFYLQHPGIPKIAKDIYTGKTPVTDDSSIMALMDSVFTKNKETQPFYFLTITGTMKQADGAYAEPLGTMARKYVETQTSDFLNYFINEPLLTEEHFNLWARNVAWEIMLDAEVQREKAEVKITETKMKANCKSCTKEQTNKMNDFIKRVGDNIIKYSRK
ncbi:MAG: hypothetical protein M3R17_09430 [Bacteroidota bacterium]|nr:hypothetical protein [Bacteroidota bacterium]